MDAIPPDRHVHHTESPFAWFCLKSRPKHEHIAARHLAGMDGVETFLPRIRFRRKTRQGPAWVTEALFPGYLFARFDWHASLRRVHHAPGVAGVVHFGDKWPTLAAAAIAELRELCGPDELRILSADMEVGDAVEIAAGAFQGLQAVVTRVMPAKARIAVLLGFLGRQTQVELPQDAVIRQDDVRTRLP
ncbi:MAG: hypothetical protein IH623_29375 [Verrucomicrobia bacterium]|nr:hypothetical protein [Verrucomicrobiota bacterium]